MATVDKDEQAVSDEEQEERVKNVQSHYLRCPSPSRLSTASDRFSTMSDRFSMISGFSNSESIFMEPINLSASIAAKIIINEELPKKEVKITPVPESMLESAEQLMVEDLYNRVKDMIDDRSPYNTPCVLDIQRALVKDHLEAPLNAVDEVWPNIFIGEKSVAVNKSRLKRMGITHILNAAHGTGVYTGQAFYAGMNITYMGIEVDDFADADISPHFRSAAEFLDEALLTHRGKVLVDSMMGVSRSAVLVTAYLMIFQDMTIMEALMELRKKRAINPNEGFIKQLRQLNENLQEERDDEENETLSQCSVIDTRAHMDEDEEESVMGVKAHSIMMEEEEDCASVMSSVASSAAALRAGLQAAHNGVDASRSRDNPELPGKGGEDEDDDDDDINSVIREWQKRNEKYQSDDWWEAQLMSECGDDMESLANEGKLPLRPEDLESVTSEDVRVMKEILKKRSQGPASESGSTASCSSYSEMWRQHLKEIEEQAAGPCQARDKEASDDTEGEKSGKNSRQKKIDDDLESLMSDSSSLYNFCKKNKETLTPLERWRVKRLQYGWNKKETESDTGSVISGAGPLEGDGEAPAPSLEDVNVTAYQTWKRKQQKKYGEENKDELLEMCRGEDSATAKRRQRREELLERSRKTLEESQSVCGWDEASGSSIPLSAFCAGDFPASSAAGDDNISMLSGRSSLQSQARSLHSQPPGQPAQLPPMPPMSNQNGEPMVNLAGIQSWISNVVMETLMQKQGDMMEGSVLSFPAGSALSMGTRSRLGSVRGLDDDRMSMLSGASYSSVQSRSGRAESVLSAGRASRPSSEYGNASSRNKITTTSVPLYSLFEDQVNLNKLDSMDKEMKLGMRNTMASYEKKKIAEDNKRSTLFKKKKAKEEDEEEDQGEDYGAFPPHRYSPPTTTRPKIKRDYGLSGHLNISGIERDKASSIDDWLRDVRPPARKTEPVEEDETREVRNTDESSAFNDRSRHRFSHTSDDDDEVEYSTTRRSANSNYSDLGRSASPQLQYQPRQEAVYSHQSRRSYTESTTRSEHTDTGVTAGNGVSRDIDDEEENLNDFISQIRQRCRERVQRELEEKEDEVLEAWRSQEESKSKSAPHN